MRVTLTMDDDLAALIEQEAKSAGESFERMVNRLLLRGLELRHREAEAAKAVPPSMDR